MSTRRWVVLGAVTGLVLAWVGLRVTFTWPKAGKPGRYAISLYGLTIDQAEHPGVGPDGRTIPVPTPRVRFWHSAICLAALAVGAGAGGLIGLMSTRRRPGSA